jgi:hypothetical protein
VRRGLRVALVTAIAIPALIAGCVTADPARPSGSTGSSPFASAGPATSSGASGSPSSSPGSPTATSPASTRTPASPAADLTAALSSIRLPDPLTRSVALVDGGSVLVAGGLAPSGTTSAILRLDPASGTVVTAGHLATAVHDAAGAALGGSWLVLGGGRVTQDSGVQGVATSGASSVVGQLPAPRADLSALTVGTDVIVLGGGAKGTADPRVLATADGRAFRVIASLPVAVRYGAAAPLDGLVYLFGGTSDAGDVAAIQVVDLAAGTARLAGNLPRTLSHATAFVLGGRIYVVGGRHHGGAVDTILRFDPATGKAVPAGRLPRAISDAAAAVIGGTAYLIGGEAAAPLDTIVALVAAPR